MKYDSERGIIRIALDEFVSIARRGISPSVSHDEDEPELYGVSQRRVSAIIGDVTNRELSHQFTDGEYSFELFGDGYISGGEITVFHPTESNPNRPRKSEVAELRGEGYIGAYMLAKSDSLDAVSIRLVFINEASGEYSQSLEIVKIGKLE